MDSSTIIIIAILCVVVVFFLFATFKIFGNKKSKEKKPKKVKQKKQKSTEEDVVVPAKVAKPKINKTKLKEMASKDAKVEPAFSKEELEKERQEKLQNELEKNRENARQANPFMFPGMPFPIQPPMPTPTRSSTPVLPQKRQENRLVKTYEHKLSTESLVKSPLEEQKENEEFIKALQQKGIIKKNLTFGESLIIKEAIDTPASKKEMKKKRQKWL